MSRNGINIKFMQSFVKSMALIFFLGVIAISISILVEPVPSATDAPLIIHIESTFIPRYENELNQLKKMGYSSIIMKRGAFNIFTAGICHIYAEKSKYLQTNEGRYKLESNIYAKARYGLILSKSVYIRSDDCIDNVEIYHTHKGWVSREILGRQNNLSTSLTQLEIDKIFDDQMSSVLPKLVAEASQELTAAT